MKKIKVGIINLGIGNIGSVCSMLKRLHIDFILTSDLELIQSCSHVILPGVGSFKNVYQKLCNELDVQELKSLISQNKFNILGICIGMQLLADSGVEGGQTEGLGLINGKIRKLADVLPQNLKIPHIGWNFVQFNKNLSLMDSDFYFVHSYFFDVENKANILGTVNYGIELPVFVKKDNVFGAQFHPEKSQLSGINFINYFLSH